MGKRAIALTPRWRHTEIDSDAILNALPSAIVVVDKDDRILHVNSAGEQFLCGSAQYLQDKKIADLLPSDSPFFSLLRRVRSLGQVISEYEVTLESPRIGERFVNIQATPLPENSETVVIAFHQRSIADKIDRQLIHRSAARSVSAMAAMLAHEIKNPLSGIRGAAQLIEQNTSPDDRDLTRLICDEVDRICNLVDRMDAFSDGSPAERDAVNIHQVLDRVHQLAKNGFGRHLHFVTDFDPSLPPVLGNRDQLVQVFLNLVKNAAEAAPESGGEVTMETAYQQGVRFAVPGRELRVHLPLKVTITDNGDGIPDDLKAHLFDPFVTSKPSGSGLGLAMVAKIISDHGGVVEYTNKSKRTTFRVMLPVFKDEALG